VSDAAAVLPAGPLPAALLFDMDGLLVDTERTWYAVETELMAGLGAPWGEEHQAALVGGPLEKSVRYMLDHAGRPDVSPDQLAQALLEGMVRHLRAGPVRWQPGAERLLAQAADAGVPCALVSSSLRPVVDAVLAAIGTEHFAVTVSGDDVAQTKPNPDPYLLAAELLGVDPVRCVALEDSETGATSAVAAGCLTVVVPSLVPVPPEIGDHQVASLTELDLARLGDLAADRAHDR
jgi:HAD superfamily hydrolase (TIGR01509 family)